MAPWQQIFVEASFVLAVILHTAVAQAIMCVRCDSRFEKTKSECQNNPPSPTRCSTGSDVINRFCMTARELSKNGTLLRFIRDCSTSKMGNECKEIGSTNPNSPHVICYRTCNYDGCNRSSLMASSSSWGVVAGLALWQSVLLVRNNIWLLPS